MKTKTLWFTFFTLFICILNSCDKEDIEIRTLQQDVDVLYHFVCIDREGLRYYLAFGEDNDHLDLIPKEIIAELDKVAAISLIQFYEELEYLNAQLKEESKKEDVIIVLSTLYDEYEYYYKKSS